MVGWKREGGIWWGRRKAEGRYVREAEVSRAAVGVEEGRKGGCERLLGLYAEMILVDT